MKEKNLAGIFIVPGKGIEKTLFLAKENPPCERGVKKILSLRKEKILKICCLT